MEKTWIPSKRLLSYGDAAKIVGISTRTVQRYVAKGLIRTVPIGPRLKRIPQSEVDRLLEYGVRELRAPHQPKQLSLINLE